jgi:PPOX class probable F420-dependent enzyme
MDRDFMRRRLGEARVGHLATVRPDGRPHLVPCCFALDGDTLFTAVDGKPKSTLALQRLANLAAHPIASLLVDHYDDEWADLWWIRVDGVARIVDIDADRTAALERLAARYRQYRLQPPPGPVVAIDITGWTAWP